MTLQEIIRRFYSVVAYKLRHEHYDKTVERAKEYTTLITGEGMDDMLRTYVKRESPELFTQRKALTIHVVSSVCKNLLDIFSKVPRSNAARKTIAYTKQGGEVNIAKLNKILEQFWGEFSFEDYMETRLIDLENIDPNSFVVYEFKPFDNTIEHVKPYPFEVQSVNAIDYVYENNELQYLICANEMERLIDPLKLGDTTNKEKYTVYTLYTKNQVFQLRQIKSTELTNPPTSEEGVVVTLNDTKYILLAGKTYEFLEFEAHNLNRVQARKVGYVTDKIRSNIFLNCIDAAVPFLKKMIKTNSELDLVATLLAFPQQMSYENACDFDLCNGGYIGDTTNKCPACAGTGWKATALSAQDSIKIKMPKSKEEMIPLADVVYYNRPPVDIIEWQEQYIDKLTEKCKAIIFNSDIFTRQEIAGTATGQNLSMQNVYDTLYPFAKNYARAWKFGVEVIADLADLNEDLLVLCSFDKDFKLKSLEDLLVDLKAANDGGSSSNLIEHINDDIALIIYDNKKSELQKYRTRQKYNPFAGKSDKDIIMLMAQNFVPKRNKVFYSNFGAIFDELEIEALKAGKDFYQYETQKQIDLIKIKVDEYVAIIEGDYEPIQLPTAENPL